MQTEKRITMNKTPKGCSNIGGLVAEKIEYCRNKALKLYSIYGYRPFSPAEFQLVENVWENVSRTRARRFIPVMTPHGEACVLRGDHTLSAVTYLSTHFSSNERPLRLSYADRIYSVPTSPKANLEENQVGIELMGWESTGADVETVSLLFKTLDILGIEKSIIVLGDVSILTYLLRTLSKNDAERITDALQNISYTEYRNILETLNIQEDLREVLAMLPSLKGGPEVIDRLEKYITDQSVTEPLKTLCCELSALGYRERIKVDLSFVRDLGYYSGPIFNAYHMNTYALLGGGGRYDGLLSKIGVEGEACGFALNLKNLADHCANCIAAPRIMLWGGSSAPSKLLTYSSKLAEHGLSFELSWTKDRTTSQSIACRRGYDWWIDFPSKTAISLTKNETIDLKSFERSVF